MITRMTAEVPPEFLAGVAEITVSPRTVPHPEREEIYTLGECVPLPAGEGGTPETVQSRIILYHGSFRALAGITEGFDWREEAWETLTHELRHHLEWRARTDALEDFDRAAEENFARHEGEDFDPLFFLDGEEVAAGVYQVDDDFFLDRIVGAVPASLDIEWHGDRYRLSLPPGLTLPVYLVVSGLAEPPPGDVVLALRRKPSLLDLFRRAVVQEIEVAAHPLTR
jgi:hypothetical protein